MPRFYPSATVMTLGNFLLQIYSEKLISDKFADFTIWVILRKIAYFR